jgi:hypothetical protein
MANAEAGVEYTLPFELTTAIPFITKDPEYKMEKGKNLFHFTEDNTHEGVYTDADSGGSAIIGTGWYYNVKKDTSRIIMRNDSGDVGYGPPATINIDITDLMATLDQNTTYTLTVYNEVIVSNWGTVPLVYIDGNMIIDNTSESASITFIPSETNFSTLTINTDMGMQKGDLCFQIEEGITTSESEYEDYNKYYNSIEITNSDQTHNILIKGIVS